MWKSDDHFCFCILCSVPKPVDLEILSSKVDSLTVGWRPTGNMQGLTGYELFLRSFDNNACLQSGFFKCSNDVSVLSC